MKGVVLFAFAVTGMALHGAQPHPLMVDYNRAWQLAGQARPYEAIPLLKQIIAKDRTFHLAYETLIFAYQQTKEFDRGEEYFRSLVAQSPRNGFAYYGLGGIYRLKNQHQAAAGYFASCIRQSPEAYACYSWLVSEWAVAHRNTMSHEELKRLIPLDSASPYPYIALAPMYSCQLKQREAIQAGEKGLELARKSEDLELPAVFENLLAGIYWGYGDQFGRVLAHEQEALRIWQELGNWELQLYAMAQIGGAYRRIGESAAALEALQRGLALARQLGHKFFEARFQEELGEYYAWRGDRTLALEAYRWAANEFMRFYEGATLNVLQKIGGLYESQGDLKNARESFEKYHATAVKSGEKWSEAFALRRLGDVYRDSGEFFEALHCLTQALTLFRGMGRNDNAGAALRVIASVHSALGNFPGAIDSYQQSLRAAQAIQDAEQQERIQQDLGQLSLRMEKPRTALVHLDKALALSARTPSTNLRSRTLLYIGDAWRMLGSDQLALSNLKAGLQIAREIHAKAFEAQALIAVGEMDLKADNLASAETHFLDGLDLAEQTGVAELTLAARRRLGETYARKGDYGQALQHLQAAIETIESLRGRIPTAELKSDFVQENWKAYEETIYVLSRLHDRHPTEGYDRHAFYYGEKGRARSFLDQLAESRARITKGLTSGQQQQQASLLAAMAQASEALHRHNSDSSRQTVREVEQNFEQWTLELRRTNPKYQELRYPEPDDAGKAQARLGGTGITLLEYDLGEKRSYVWAISEGRVQMATLPSRREIEKEVALFRAIASLPPKGSQALDACRASGRRLYELLVEPVGKSLLGAQKVLIVPDGILYYLPFEALIRRNGDRQRYMVEDYTIAYAPSASVFGKLEPGRRQNERPRRELLAYGDPLFETAQVGAGSTGLAEVVRGAYRASGIQFPRLPNTRVEVEGIGGLFSPANRKIYLGRSATESSVKLEKLTEYKRLHFATHAVIDERTPARSGIVLSLVSTGAEDGILRASEIFNLELDADLVVLSACQTGLGKLIRGEGMIGLTRAFLYAGSPRVLVSLWQVNDLATAEFMKIFYQKMKAGGSPGIALREAKLAMIHSGVLAYQYPFFWTPFVLVGTF